MDPTDHSQSDQPADKPFSVFFTFVFGMLGFVLFFGMAYALVKYFRTSEDYETQRGRERLEARLAIDDEAATAVTSYIWIDPSAGTLAIPVDRAAQLVIDELNAKPVGATLIPVPGTPAAQAALQAPADPWNAAMEDAVGETAKPAADDPADEPDQPSSGEDQPVDPEEAP